MLETLENRLQLGNGIYTITEIAHILGIPAQKVRRWISKYWDGELGRVYEQNYSWTIGDNKAVGFHTLVEFFVMVQFAESGANIRQILTAHQILAKKHLTIFPFAIKDVLDNISTDRKKIFLRQGEDVITLDGTKQLNLEFIKMFFKKLDFDKDMLATRLWPLGKSKEIVCDPHHRFGQPVIKGTNIQAEAIYRMYLAKEPVKSIAELYDISSLKIKHAIEFYKPAA
jgi:uncharacterized protein (DUF433 family)